MQDISDAAAANINAGNARPVLVLKLPYSGQDYYFASEELALPYEISGKLLLCKSLEEKTGRDLVSGSEKITLRISDLGEDVFAALETGELEGSRAELIQCFNGEGEESGFVIFAGIVSASSEWAEFSLQLELDGYGSLFEQQLVLRLASRDFFPGILPEDEGQTLPRSFGRPKRVKATRVVASPVTTLAGLVDTGATEFYVTDAKNFPLGEITLKVDEEYITGSFSGNRFTVTARGDYDREYVTSSKSGNPSLLRLRDLENGAGDALVGLFASVNIEDHSSVRHILGSFDDGVVNISTPFTDKFGIFYHPGEDERIRIFSKVRPHAPGTRVSLSDESAYYIINDAPVEEVLQVEGVVEDGFCPIPQNLFSVSVSDAQTFPALGREVAVLKLQRLPTRINMMDIYQQEYENDEVYVTLVAQNAEGSPSDIIRSLLLSAEEVSEDYIDEASFAAAATERNECRFSFTQYKNLGLLAFINDLCFQARLSLLWQRGKFKLLPIINGLAQVDKVLGSDEVVSFAYCREAEAEIVDGVEATYSGGVVCAYREGSSKNNIRKINLWAYDSYEQAQYQAQWWLRRLSSGWQKATVQAYLPASILQRHDVVELSLPGVAGDGFVGSVRSFKRLPIDDENKIEVCEVELAGPSWAGCLSSCETTCESGACESSGCEMSCTASCELVCQAGCEVDVENYPMWFGKGCRTTCQISCRAADETGCGSSSCESGCESGCEISCEGASFEAVCPSGCETAQELGTISSYNIIKATVLSGPGDVGGAVSISNDATGEVLTAYDVCDLRPVSGTRCTAIRTEDGQWCVAEAGRTAKYVRVVSGGGGSYTVVECDSGGNAWGSNFTAILP